MCSIWKQGIQSHNWLRAWQLLLHHVTGRTPNALQGITAKGFSYPLHFVLREGITHILLT